MLKKITAELEQLASLGRLRQLHTTKNRRGATVEIRGKRVVDFTSWDLFGLNEERRFRSSLQSEIERVGLGTCSPRSSSGSHRQHASCEFRIAQFLGCESAVLFSSKNQAVLSLITSLASEGDTVFAEESIQSPVADAAHLVNAQVQAFQAGALDQLRSDLQKAKPFGRKLLFVEALSPVTGLEADLRGLSNIATASDAALIVDETYSIGALGLRGAGGCEQVGISRSVFCIYGSLAHGLASYGAFAAGPAVVAGYLTNRSKTFSSEPPLPPAIAAGVETAIDIVELSPVPREQNKLKAARVRRALREIGFPKIEGQDSPVVCIPASKMSEANELAEALFQRGFLVEPVSKGLPKSEGALVRLVVTPQHADKQIDDLLSAISDIHKKLEKL